MPLRSSRPVNTQLRSPPRKPPPAWSGACCPALPPAPHCPRPCQLTLRPCGTRCLAARCPCACCPPCPRVPPPFPVPLGDLNPRLDKLLLALTSVRPSQQSQPRPPSEPAPCPGMLPLPVDRCPSCQGKTPGGQAKEWGWQAHGTPWPHSRGHCFVGVVQWVKGRVLATARFLPIVPPVGAASSVHLPAPAPLPPGAPDHCEPWRDQLSDLRGHFLPPIRPWLLWDPVLGPPSGPAPPVSPAPHCPPPSPTAGGAARPPWGPE